MKFNIFRLLRLSKPVWKKAHYYKNLMERSRELKLLQEAYSKLSLTTPTLHSLYSDKSVTAKIEYREIQYILPRRLKFDHREADTKWYIEAIKEFHTEGPKKTLLLG